MNTLPVPRLPHHLLRHARVLPSREDILGFLPNNGVFVEIGVAFGDFTRKILATCKPQKMFAIDFFNIERHPVIWGKPVEHWLGSKTHKAFYAERFAVEIREERLHMLIGNAFDQLQVLDDASIDIFYVDAGHSYDELREQLGVLRRKVKPTGYIIMNDYTFSDYNSATPSFYGVIQATHEFMIAHEWEMIFLALHPEMFCDVVLRKVDIDEPALSQSLSAGEDCR